MHGCWRAWPEVYRAQGRFNDAVRTTEQGAQDRCQPAAGAAGRGRLNAAVGKLKQGRRRISLVRQVYNQKPARRRRDAAAGRPGRLAVRPLAQRPADFRFRSSVNTLCTDAPRQRQRVLAVAFHRGNAAPGKSTTAARRFPS